MDKTKANGPCEYINNQVLKKVQTVIVPLVRNKDWEKFWADCIEPDFSLKKYIFYYWWQWQINLPYILLFQNLKLFLRTYWVPVTTKCSFNICKRRLGRLKRTYQLNCSTSQRPFYHFKVLIYLYNWWSLIQYK